MIKVLVADDSAFMRASLTHILQSDSAIEVIGTAVDGDDALRKVIQLKPDVLLLDIEMPRMDGLTALSYIMTECPTPVIIVSGLGEKDARLAIKSLEAGAIDFIPKPSGVISYDIESIKDEIISKVKIAAGIDVRKITHKPAKRHYPVAVQKPARTKDIVIIGASTGGPRAVAVVLSGLQRNISAAILIVQHMAKEFIPSFVERLKWECLIDVSIAQDNEIITPGRVIVAQGNCNTMIESMEEDKKILINSEIAQRTVAPSIDYAMKSAARAYGDTTLGVLLTGIGRDGAEGLKAIKDAGGTTIAEDESSCIVYGMPRTAIEMGVVDEVVPLPMIADAIMQKLRS